MCGHVGGLTIPPADLAVRRDAEFGGQQQPGEKGQETITRRAESRRREESVDVRHGGGNSGRLRRGVLHGIEPTSFGESAGSLLRTTRGYFASCAFRPL